MKNISCNLVTVKASKETPDGIKTWEGKVPFDNLRICKSKTWIPIWRSPKADRASFTSTFGSSVDLFPEDIDEIIFRKKTLYKKGE